LDYKAIANSRWSRKKEKDNQRIRRAQSAARARWSTTPTPPPPHTGFHNFLISNFHFYFLDMSKITKQQITKSTRVTRKTKMEARKSKIDGALASRGLKRHDQHQPSSSSSNVLINNSFIPRIILTSIFLR
jgi:hypothetical protein